MDAIVAVYADWGIGAKGTQPLVSYQYGKEDYTSCRKLLRYGFTAVAVMTAVIFAAVMAFAPQIAALFLGEEKAGLVVSDAHLYEDTLEDYFKRITGGEGIA